LYQLAIDSPAYNGSLASCVRSQVDVEALHRSLQALVDRHASLHTTYTSLDGEPVQYVHERLAVRFRHERLADVTDSELLEYVAREADRPFDLENEPVFRAVLFTRSAADHVLLLTFHHIGSDFLSLPIFLRELGILYEGEANGREISLPPIAAEYTDYVAWQADLLQGADADAHWFHWERQLVPPLPLLDLPIDKPRPLVQTGAGAVQAFELDERLVRALRSLARAEGVTLYVVLLAAFYVLLHRYTAQEDIVVGSFTSGRVQPQFGKVFGYFVNPIALRARLQGDSSFRSLLSQVRQTVSDARKHSDYPFSLLVERLGLTQDAAHSPVFQGAFNMVETREPGTQGLSLFVAGQANGRIELGRLVLESLPIGQSWSQFDLTLTIELVGNILYGFLEYNTDLFLPATIVRMTEQLTSLLESIVAAPDEQVEGLTLLGERQRHEMLFGWNDTRRDYPEQMCLHHLVEQQVCRTPDKVAAISDNGQLTYAEMNARANQLAHHLRSLGVSPDISVGVYLDRSPDLIVAILGILKAGGAYLPLDIDMPPLRLREVLECAQAPICICRDTSDIRLLDDLIARVHLIDWTETSRYPDAAPNVTVSPDHLVSVYYTSGSTGHPKGVANTHRGWVNRMTWMQHQYQLQADETVLQKTPLTFDDAAVEVFWPLIVGGRVALLGPGLHKDPRAILEAAVGYEAAVLQFVPSMLNEFLGILTPRDRINLHYLRHVISSGEALRGDTVRAFYERLDTCELHNHWGATEVSIDSTAHTCSDADLQDGIVSIGYPIANNQVYILDRHLQPVPVGVVGDLHLAGAGLARGYLNDPERTAEAFVPNEFMPGTLMYKTGDRGRYRGDGSILFVGRGDGQVKIRGQRVELAEIEAVLATHSRVKDCAVVARSETNGYRLVAYFVVHPANGEAPDDKLQMVESLRSLLVEHLPQYMVPGRFICMESLPLTMSGKVDRKKLPALGDERPELEKVCVAPRTLTEAAVASIWQQVLGLTEVGIHDQFVELGGHSLDATRIMSRIDQELGARLPLRVFFEAGTIAGLALRVDQVSSKDGPEMQQRIVSLPPRALYELSHAQQRLWFQYQFDRGNAYGALLTVEIDGHLVEEIVARALRGVVGRHGILRTTFTERGGTTSQIVHRDMAFPHRYCDLSTLPAEEQSRELATAASLEKQTPFDLTVGPLLRSSLYKLAERSHRLLLNIHPIAFDGWSVGVLLEDLKALYYAYEQGGSSNDFAPALQYVDYAAWQNQRLASGELDEQRAYWLERFATVPPLSQLPHTETVPRECRTPPYRVTTVSPDLTRRLREVSATHGVTLYMTLLSGLNMWMARLSGQTNITIGAPMSGRTRPELEKVFGVLWNPVALRTDLSGNPTCLDVLRRVQRTTLEAYANQDYPFDLVVQDLRRIWRTEKSLYSVVFVLQNAIKDMPDSDGITLRPSLSERLLVASNRVTDSLGDDLTIRYDLHIEIFEVDDHLMIVVQHSPVRFRSGTADHFLVQMISILDQFSSDPDLRLSQLSLLELDPLDELFEDEL